MASVNIFAAAFSEGAEIIFPERPESHRHMASRIGRSTIGALCLCAPLNESQREVQLVTEQDVLRVFDSDSDAENPKDRVGASKPPLHLIPPAAEIAEAVVMGLGASKYGPYNWRSANVKATVYISAARRHLAQWLDGEDDDPESGVSHLAHARACLGILLDALATEHLVDDRPAPGVASELIAHHTTTTSAGVNN